MFVLHSSGFPRCYCTTYFRNISFGTHQIFDVDFKMRGTKRESLPTAADGCVVIEDTKFAAMSTVVITFLNHILEL